MTPHPPRYADSAKRPRLTLAKGDGGGIPPDPALTQGFIMRGYNLAFIRYFALSVTDAKEARSFIAKLTSGEQAWPRVTIASAWLPPKPDRCLNIGFTYGGLGTLGVAPDILNASFGPGTDHQPFQQGAKARSASNGDVGRSASSNWRIDDSQFHVMMILWGDSLAVIEEETEALRPLLAPGFGDLRADRMFDSQALDDRRVWFGYKDGIAQPHVAGVPYPMDDDGDQLLAPSGAFMLGTSTDGPYTSPSMTRPPVLGLHGCFGAFRILEQDVDGFERQAETLARDPAFLAQYRITDPAHAIEAVKALICGRWLDGVPLSVFPIDGDNKPPKMLDNKLNDFLYVLPNGNPDNGPNVDPDKGSSCPIGAHIRRGNMRGYPLAETPSVYHRIIRRASAYQAPYPPKDAEPGERGLMGFFLGSCLRDQFEFVQQNWINNWTQQTGFGGVRDTTDPLIGTPEDGDFFETIGIPKQKQRLKNMQAFVYTRGSAYCFFPGIDGIAWIAAQTGGPAAGQAGA